ncbi:MAG: ferredoxin [Deltaproteobacteria bacterium]|nr:ferredoxin [Deltaproteobacteria bacterium]
MGSTDIEHYIARAKANGRDPSLIKGGEGLNTADDGERYWGPLDNESSRAKAAGKKLSIDQWECISCGTCVEQTDRVFVLPDDGKASPIAQDGPMDLIQDAIEACPVTCIHWVTPAEAAEKGLATGE